MKTRSIMRYALPAAPISLILIASVVIAQQPKSASNSKVNVSSDESAKSVESNHPESPSANMHVTVDGKEMPVEKNGTTRTDTGNGSVTVTNSEDDNTASGASNSNSVNLNVSTDTTNSSTHTTTTIRHNATTSIRSKESVHVRSDGDANINISN